MCVYERFYDLQTSDRPVTGVHWAETGEYIILMRRELLSMQKRERDDELALYENPREDGSSVNLKRPPTINGKLDISRLSLPFLFFFGIN